MSFKSIVAWAAAGALKAVGSPIPGPIGDVKNGFDAVVMAVADLRAKQFSFTDATSVLNAIQALLVDAGIEPKVIEEALTLAGTLIPLLVEAWRAVGVDPFAAAPRSGPPITEGNFSGAPEQNNADNPSGAIGGPN